MSGYTLVGLNRKRTIKCIHFKHVKGPLLMMMFGYTLVYNEPGLMYM